MFPLVMLVLLAVNMLFVGGCAPEPDELGEPEEPEEAIVAPGVEIQLLPPSFDGQYSLEHVLARRFSVRSFRDDPLSLAKLSQLLWAAQGMSADAVTGATRTAPSAGATHPLDVFVVAGKVTGMEPGIYHYQQERHLLAPVVAGDFRADLAGIALNQDFIAAAPVTLILTADYVRTTQRYGERGIRYVYMEIGHATQNVLLQAVALDLGSVAVGAFHDDPLKTLLATEYAPLMIIPVGYLD